MKNTYGTGCFLLMNTGRDVPRSESGLVSTVAWRRAGATTYALEGSVFIAGAAVQWLRDEVGLIKDAGESEKMALAVPDTGGVYFVPAFVGLGAPHWDAYARGTIVGLTRGSNRNHLVRAALESMAYQTRAVVDCMAGDSGIRPEALRVDGGAARNNFLCQFQADILGIAVERPATSESTALGAAYLGGLATGFWKDEPELGRQFKIARRFEPAMSASRREELYAGWRRAVGELKRRGWIHAFGISVNRWEPQNVLAALETGLVDSVQVVYNIFDQAPEDVLFPACQRLGIAVIARVPFDEGSLTGTLTTDSRWPAGDFRNVYFAPEHLALTVPRVDRLRSITAEHGLTLPDLALRFVLSHPAVTTTIPGMRHIRHVDANLAAGSAEALPAAAIEALRAHRWDRQPDARP